MVHFYNSFLWGLSFQILKMKYMLKCINNIFPLKTSLTKKICVEIAKLSPSQIPSLRLTWLYFQLSLPPSHPSIWTVPDWSWDFGLSLEIKLYHFLLHGNFCQAQPQGPTPIQSQFYRYTLFDKTPRLWSDLGYNYSNCLTSHITW